MKRIIGYWYVLGISTVSLSMGVPSEWRPTPNDALLMALWRPHESGSLEKIIEKAEAAIREGADINMKVDYSTYPVIIDVMDKYRKDGKLIAFLPGIINMLVEAGLNVNIFDHNGDSLLCNALHSFHQFNAPDSMIVRLLEEGAEYFHSESKFPSDDIRMRSKEVTKKLIQWGQIKQEDLVKEVNTIREDIRQMQDNLDSAPKDIRADYRRGIKEEENYIDRCCEAIEELHAERKGTLDTLLDYQEEVVPRDLAHLVVDYTYPIY